MNAGLLIKIIGGSVVICSSFVLGYILSTNLSIRSCELRQLQNILEYFENEIKFLSSKLTEALEKSSKMGNGAIAKIFTDTSYKLKECYGTTVEDEWERAVLLNRKKMQLANEDIEILLSFGKILGKSDLEGQIKNIKNTINRLKIQEQKAEERRKKDQIMYRNITILCGIAIVIILV